MARPPARVDTWTLLSVVAAGLLLLFAVFFLWMDPASTTGSAAAASAAAAAPGSDWLMAHSPIRSVAQPLNCSAVFGAWATAKRPDHTTPPVLAWTGSDGEVQLFGQAAASVLGYIRDDPGEAAVHALLRRLMKQECRRRRPAGAAPPVFVDVGANAGAYALLALHMGCQAMAVDPQPSCTKITAASACLNAHLPAFGRGAGVALVTRPVAARRQRVTLVDDHCSVLFGVTRTRNVKDPNNATEARDLPKVTVDTVSMDEMFLSSALTVPLVKVDTEGLEPSVLKSMEKLLRARRVRFLVMEVSPGYWREDGADLTANNAAFQMLLDLGCQIRRVADVDMGDAFPGGPVVATTMAELQPYFDKTGQDNVLVVCPQA